MNTGTPETKIHHEATTVPIEYWVSGTGDIFAGAMPSQQRVAVCRRVLGQLKEKPIVDMWPSICHMTLGQLVREASKYGRHNPLPVRCLDGTKETDKIAFLGQEIPSQITQFALRDDGAILSLDVECPGTAADFLKVLLLPICELSEALVFGFRWPTFLDDLVALHKAEVSRIRGREARILRSQFWLETIVEKFDSRRQ